jgi:putative transposase
MKQSGKYNKKVQIPKYLDKEGYFTLSYTNQQLGRSILSGIIKLPLSDISFHTNKTNIKLVRFIPHSSYIVMEVVYEVKDIDMLCDNSRYAGIDLGINNLATITSNISQSYIVNGRPVKSINQYYNKVKANLQSQLKDRRTSKRIQRLTFKRNCKIKDYFHKSTSYIVNQLVSDSINTVVIGQNKDWKQDINIGTKNNQSFTSIPHSMFINMLKYKCRLKGINIVCIKESYTSKSSFLDSDSIPSLKDENISFSGKRIKRGLYRSSTGYTINADVNGSFNILRKFVLKEVGDVDLLPADRGFVFNPIRISF